jgi:ABC-type amino acid transport substrate-binding protein
MKQVLKIGLDSAAPFPMHTDYHSEIFEGFEVDLLRIIAKSLDLEIQYEVSLWKDILEQLYKGELDLICSAVSITPTRMRILEFSDPYLQFRLCAVIKQQDHLDDLAKLKHKVIGVRAAAEAEKYMMKHYPVYTLRHMETNREMYDALLQGDIDLLIDDSPIAGGFLKKHKTLKIGSFLPDTDTQYAIAMKKGDLKLKSQINTVLHNIRKNGVYQQLFAKWFTQIQL